MLPFSTPPSTRNLRPATLLMTLALALSGCAEEEQQPPPPRVAFVETLQPAEPEPRALRFSGVVESVTSTELSFQVSGRIERILVDEGTRVTRGQPLAQLDRTDYELQLREATARHRQLQADLARKRQLLAEGILAPAAVEPLEAELVAATVARDAAQRNIGYATLTAPFDGVVAQRMAEPDMVVGSGTPILRMQDNQRVEVGVDLSENAALSIPLGPQLQAEGQLVIAEDVTLPLRYKEHSTQPREGSRTYRLILQGEPPADYNLLPGMALRVTLQRPAPPAEEGRDRYRMPVSALQTASDGSHFVWLVVDGQAQRGAVEVLGIEREQVVIRTDLGIEAQIVVAGGSKLSEGQPIQAQQRN